MNTNIKKLHDLYSMHLHTAKEVDELLQNYLPHGYSTKVVEIAKKRGRETYKDLVRKVKSVMTEDIQILNILIEIAQENKAIAEAQKKKLKELTSK